MRLIAIDLDGTLLADDCSISKENRESIREVQRQGDIIAISSGRALHDIKQILHKAELDCPIIAGNGAVLFNDGQIIHKHTLHANVVKEVMQTLEENDVYYEIYTKNGVLIKTAGGEHLLKEIENAQNQVADFNSAWARNEIAIQFMQHGLLPVPHYHDIDFSDLEVYKLFVMCFDHLKLTKLKELLKERTNIGCTYSGLKKIDIGHVESSKGNSLKLAADHFGVAIENTVAIGDNLNDLSMFEVAGTSIAMGNAVEELKKISTYITKTNNEHGIAHALQNYILEKLRK